MRYSLLIFPSLITLTACTQPASLVDMRGQESFGRNATQSFAYNTAAPVAPVGAASISYGSTQSSYKETAPQQMAAAQPTQTVPMSSSIGVSDLEPAAGKAEAKIEDKPVAKNILKIEEKAEPKTESNAHVLSAEAAPVNAWTKKPRDNSAFEPKVAAKDAQYIWPVSSHDVTTSFDKNNEGINIAAGNGEPVWAAADGEVVYADSKMQGYGKMVIVKHSGGKTSTYAHLARYGVEKYDRVKQGDIIGYVGTTGKANKPQLYFSMRDGTKAVDPQKYLDRKVAGL